MLFLRLSQEQETKSVWKRVRGEVGGGLRCGGVVRGQNRNTESDQALRLMLGTPWQLTCAGEEGDAFEVC